MRVPFLSVKMLCCLWEFDALNKCAIEYQIARIACQRCRILLSCEHKAQCEPFNQSQDALSNDLGWYIRAKKAHGLVYLHVVADQLCVLAADLLSVRCLDECDPCQLWIFAQQLVSLLDQLLYPCSNFGQGHIRGQRIVLYDCAHALPEGCDQLVKNGFFARKVEVEGWLCDACVGDNRTDLCLMIAKTRKFAGRCLQ